MSLPATITLTIATVPYVLRRINQDNYGSEYSFSGADRALSMKIRHSTDSVDKDAIVMKRHNVFVEQVVYPTPTANMKKESWTFTMRGGSLEDPILTSDLAKACTTWANTGTTIVDLSVGDN